MKYLVVLLVISCSLLSFAQHKQNLGVTIGTTQFSTESDAFNTSETHGLTVGLAGNFVFHKRHEFSVELKYNRHKVLFETYDTKGDFKNIELILKQVEVPLTYTLNVLASKNFNFGLNLGGSANFFHEYGVDKQVQESFSLEPSGIKVNRLFFDTFDEKIGLNFYAIGGLKMRVLKHFVFTGRYHHGLSNPYRQAPADNPLNTYKADVSYYSLNFTYFF